MAFMLQDIIRFLNRPMVRRIGYYTMLIQHQDKDVAGTDPHEPNHLPGKQMERLTLEFPLKKVLY